MNCIICQKNNNPEIYPGLTHCKQCGLIYCNNSLPDNQLRELYQEDYFKGSEYLDYQNDKKIIQKNFSARIKDINRVITRGSLFEIGSAYGFFLELAKKYFDVAGIDITEQPTEYARKNLGLKVRTGNYLEFSNTSERDIFCMWDTIEHLSNPKKFIEKINSELKPGGFLFLTTGDIGSLVAKFKKDKWRMIHPPTHLYYFSEKSITALLEKSGFTVIKISHPGVYRSLKQMAYGLLFLNKHPKGINLKIREALLKIATFMDFPIYLNTFDIMMVIAKKI